MKICVGSLSFETTDSDPRRESSVLSEVAQANAVVDRKTGRSRGFGFVDMSQDIEAKNLADRTLTVNKSRPRKDGVSAVVAAADGTGIGSLRVSMTVRST